MNVKQRECLPEYLDPGRFRKVRLHFIAALTFTQDSDETKEILQCKRSDGKYLCTNTLVLLIQRLIVEKLATCNLLFLNYFFLYLSCFTTVEGMVEHRTGMFSNETFYDDEFTFGKLKIWNVLPAAIVCDK